MKSSYKAVEHPSHFELFYEGSDKPLKVSKKGLSPDKMEEIVKHLAIGGIITQGGNIRGGLALNPSHKINTGKLVIKPIKIKKLAEGGVGVSDSGYMGDPLQATEEAEKPESSPVFDEEAASPMMKQQYGEKDNADGEEKPQMIIMAAHGGHLKKGDPDTYITKEGKETQRGLWANVYLKHKREGKLADGGEPTLESLKQMFADAAAEESRKQGGKIQTYKVGNVTHAVSRSDKPTPFVPEGYFNSTKWRDAMDEIAEGLLPEEKTKRIKELEAQKEGYEKAKYETRKRKIVPSSDEMHGRIPSGLADGGKISGIEATKRGEEKLLAHAAKQEKRMENMAKGGYVVTRSSDRKGKTHKVTNTKTGEVQYFGDSNLGQHPKDPERKAAFYARHASNLKGNPFFRAYARATWFDGGEVQNFADGDFLDEELTSDGSSGEEEVASDELNAKPDEGAGELPEREFFRSEGTDDTPGAFGEITRISPEDAQLIKEGKLELPESDVDRFVKEQEEFAADETRTKPEMERALRPAVFKMGAKIAGAKTLDDYKATLKELQPLFNKLEPKEKEAVANFMKETSSRLNEPQESKPDDIEEGKQSEEGSDEELVSKKEDKKGTPVADAILGMKSGESKKPSPMEQFEALRQSNPTYKKYFDMAMANPDATPEMADRIATAMSVSRPADVAAAESRLPAQETAPAPATPMPPQAAPAAPPPIAQVPVAPVAPPAVAPKGPYTGPLPNLGVVSAGGVGIPRGATPVAPTAAGVSGAAAPSKIDIARQNALFPAYVNVAKSALGLSQDEAEAAAAEEIARTTPAAAMGTAEDQLAEARKSPEYLQAQAALETKKAELAKQAQLSVLENNIRSQLETQAIKLKIRKQEEYEVASRVSAANRQKMRQEIINYKVDPSKYWTDMSTAGKWVTGISLLLGTIGKGIGGKGSVADYLDGLVKEEVQNQYKELDKKKSVLSDFVKEGNDLDDAFKLTEAFYKDLFSAQLQEQVDRLGIKDAMVLSQAKALQADADMQAAKTFDDILKKQIELKNLPAEMRLKTLGKHTTGLAELARLNIQATGADEREKRAREASGRQAASLGLQQEAGERAKGKEARDIAKEYGTPLEQEFKSGKTINTGQYAQMSKEAQNISVPVVDEDGNVVTGGNARYMPANSEPDAKSIKKVFSAQSKVMRNVTRLREIAKKHNYSGWATTLSAKDSADNIEAQQIMADIVASLGGNENFNLGVLQPAEWERITKLTPNPGTLERADVKKRSFDAFERTIRDAIKRSKELTLVNSGESLGDVPPMPKSRGEVPTPSKGKKSAPTEELHFEE